MDRDELQQFSRDNWNRIPEAKRKMCLDHLRTEIPGESMKGLKEHWQDPGFHMFGGGMWIRNTLRGVMKDEELPGVMYEQHEMHNWDDFYMAAVEELVKDV